MTPPKRYAAIAVLAALLLTLSSPKTGHLIAQAPSPTLPPPEDGTTIALSLVYQRPAPEIAFSYTDTDARIMGILVGDICVASQNGVLERNLTRNMVREPGRTDLMAWDPAWSPDGTLLAYTHSTWDDTDIYTVALGTGEVTNLTASPGVREEGAAWSPDGTRIAFVAQGDVHLIDADGGNRTRLTTGAGIHVVGWWNDLTWSPDGTQIAYVSDRDGQDAIYLMQADNGREQRLGPDGALGRVAPPSWAPDGTGLAFVATIHGQHGLHIMALPDQELTFLTPLAVTESPVWSPDGEWVAFSGCGGGVCYLYIIHPHGDGLLALAENGRTPSWSPDGRWLAYEGGDDIWATSVDGTFRQNITYAFPLEAFDPVWRP